MPVARGTTPTFTFHFPETMDLFDARGYFVTFSGNGVKITKVDNVVVNEHTISVSLTQEETLALGPGTVEIQVNWTYGDGLRAASSIVTYEFSRQLLLEVL